jgi:hypothetical protein
MGFGVGALFAALGFVAAYSAQLQYGKRGENDRWAHRWHVAAYLCVIISIVGFVIGLCFARGALNAQLGRDRRAASAACRTSRSPQACCCSS